MDKNQELFKEFYETTTKKELFQILIGCQTQLIGSIVGFEALIKDQSFLFNQEFLGLNIMREKNREYCNTSFSYINDKENVSRET